jgi:hypothetical protein
MQHELDAEPRELRFEDPSQPGVSAGRFTYQEKSTQVPPQSEERVPPSTGTARRYATWKKVPVGKNSYKTGPLL